MAMSIADVYAVRFCAKLSLPKIVQDNIGKLRITPAPYKPVKLFTHKGAYRHNPRFNSKVETEDWRKTALMDIVRRVKEREDPEYSEIVGIFNKISPGNLEKLSADAVGYIQKRDDTFRLRVSALLFDKSITQPSFSGIMAECARLLTIAIPEIEEDLQTQVAMFPTLYNMEETITYPEASEDDFDNKVIAWMKQKEKRRGYAKFMMELHGKDLIKEDIVKQALDQVIVELNDTIRQPAKEKTIENASHFVDFLFELSKTIKGPLKESLRTSVEGVLAIQRPEVPSLNMRCRFKLEDAFKALNKKE
jgi:hypothetical protein